MQGAPCTEKKKEKKRLIKATCKFSSKCENKLSTGELVRDNFSNKLGNALW